MRAIFASTAPQAVVVLSRRNLLALLRMLDDPESAKTVITNEVLVDDRPHPEGFLIAIAEDDSEHYDDRSPSFVEITSDRIPNVLPFGKSRRHAAGQLHPWVFRQHQVGVDRHGVEHEIESMPVDYAANVIDFCERNARRIWWTVASEDYLEALDQITGLMNDEAADAERVLRQRLKGLHQASLVNPLEWLHATPLFAALWRRTGEEE
jgi:hypothetical protein